MLKLKILETVRIFERSEIAYTSADITHVDTVNQGMSIWVFKKERRLCGLTNACPLNNCTNFDNCGDWVPTRHLEILDE